MVNTQFHLRLIMPIISPAPSVPKIPLKYPLLLWWWLGNQSFFVIIYWSYPTFHAVMRDCSSCSRGRSIWPAYLRDKINFTHCKLRELLRKNDRQCHYFHITIRRIQRQSISLLMFPPVASAKIDSIST